MSCSGRDTTMSELRTTVKLCITCGSIIINMKCQECYHKEVDKALEDTHNYYGA